MRKKRGEGGCKCGKGEGKEGANEGKENEGGCTLGKGEGKGVVNEGKEKGREGVNEGMIGENGGYQTNEETITDKWRENIPI